MQEFPIETKMLNIRCDKTNTSKEIKALVDDLMDTVNPDWLKKSGRILLSGRTALLMQTYGHCDHNMKYRGVFIKPVDKKRLKIKRCK